jgi:chromate reductase, NAD(P)H dehydrogenase (quinone)
MSESSEPSRILALAGSTRTDSYNKRLMRIAAAGAQGAGAEVTVIDLRDFGLPVFDEDLEKQHGMPAAGQRLKALFRDHDGLLIASPEYNSSITAVLKNSIDWVSRPAENEPPLVAFAGKAAVLMSASPGNLGGLRGLVHIRSILGNLGVIVLPDQVAVPRAFEAFGPDGALLDPKQQAAVTALGTKLAGFLKKLKT